MSTVHSMETPVFLGKPFNNENEKTREKEDRKRNIKLNKE